MAYLNLKNTVGRDRTSVRSRYGRDVGADKGSFVYAKIEAKSRKNDMFMALVASMVPETEIKERPATVRVPVITM